MDPDTDRVYVPAGMSYRGCYNSVLGDLVGCTDAPAEVLTVANGFLIDRTEVTIGEVAAAAAAGLIASPWSGGEPPWSHAHPVAGLSANALKPSCRRR